MLSQKRGFTLAELMIAVSIVGVFVAILIGGLVSACSGPEQKNAAKKEATSWAKELNLEFTGISCADIDSDHDGYVSCTIAMKNGDTKAIECRGAYSIGHGCRDPKMTLQRQQ